MKQYKVYNQLHTLYSKRRNTMMFLIFTPLILAVLGFIAVFIEVLNYMGLLFVMCMLLFFIGFGIVWFFARLQMKKSLKVFSPQQLKMMNEEISYSNRYEGWIVTSQAVINARGGLIAVPIKNILWVYKSEIINKAYHIFSIKTTSIVFAGRDKKKRGFVIKNKGNAYEFLQDELLKHKLDIIFGYEIGMDEIYQKDINRMISFAQECADRRLGKMMKN